MEYTLKLRALEWLSGKLSDWHLDVDVMLSREYDKPGGRAPTGEPLGTYENRLDAVCHKCTTTECSWRDYDDCEVIEPYRIDPFYIPGQP